MMAVISRGLPEQDALIEWLMDELDRKEDGRPSTGASMKEYALTGVPAGLVGLARLPSASPQQVIQIAGEIRSATGIRRVFPSPARKAVAFRGTSAQVAMAEQLVRERSAPAAR